jgi:hypothetical protein
MEKGRRTAQEVLTRQKIHSCPFGVSPSSCNALCAEELGIVIATSRGSTHGVTASLDVSNRSKLGIFIHWGRAVLSG